MASRVLVTGAGTGASNNLIRSLRFGEPSLVIVGCSSDRFFLKKSAADRNYLIARMTHPGIVDSLRRVINTEEIDVVIPTSDTDVKVIAAVREDLPCHAFIPRNDVIELCQDKCELAAFLRDRGVPAPLTYPVTHLDHVEALFRRFESQTRLWCRIKSGAGSMGAMPVRTAAQARSWMSYWEDMRGVAVTSFTLSEYLPGRDFACQSLWKHGEVVLIKTTERLAYLGAGSTPSGTSSVGTIHKTIHEPRVADVAIAAIRLLDPKISGAFSVDLKEDAEKRPCITEINVGRLLSGTTIFDLTGKHNMAVTYVKLALGEPITISEPYDSVDGYYMVRDVDTIPDIFHAEDLLEGIRDARL